MADDLLEAALAAARRTRESLGRTLLLVQDDPRGTSLSWLTTGIAQTNGRLFAIELGGAEHVRACLSEAVERLRGLLIHAQESSGSNALVEESVAALASALTVLHPTHAALQKAGVSRPVLIVLPEDDEEVEPEPLALTESERRESARTKLEVEVGLNTETNFYEGKSGDLSDGGVFVMTDRPLGIGEDVSLSLMLPTGYQIAVAARVQWVRGGGRVSGQPAGMGIRFVGLGPEDLQAIRRFTEQRRPMRR